MIVDAVCPLHGLVKVDLSGAFEFPPGAQVEFSGSRATCPLCGRPAPIVDGVYTFVGNVVRVVRESGASREDVAQLRSLAADTRAGKLSPDQATARATAINPAFASVAAPATDNLGLWALIFVILTFLLNGYMAWSADKASAQSHEDNRKQLQATESAERVQERIYEEMRRQADAAQAQARASRMSKASQPQMHSGGGNRKQRRAEAARARKGKPTSPLA